MIAMPPVISKYFRNNIVGLFLLYRREPAFARTACLAKNKRNTSPKMNSSTINATATEKTIPAMTAITVITNCITSSRESSVKGLLSACRASAGRVSDRDRCFVCCAAKDLRDLFIALPVNLDRVANAHHREELHNVTVPHANASVRGSLADRPRNVGSMNAVSLFVQTHPAGANRIVRASWDHDTRVV